MTGRPLRIIFMGTPAFSVSTLEILLSSPHQVVAVYSQPPRPSGRGHRLQKSPVHVRAEAAGIPIFTPTSLRSEEEQQIFASHQADIGIVIAYGLILPESILNTPPLGCLNVHASLLPRWRGAAPIQRAIEAGDAETGITIMQMDKGLDTGAMLLKKSTELTPKTTSLELHDTLSLMGGPLLLEAMEAYAAGQITPMPQPTEGITYAAKLSKEESQLDWGQSADVLLRKVRGFTPWPGVWFDHEGIHLKIIDAEIGDVASAGPPGLVIDDQLTIACGQKSSLCLKVLQRPGGASLETQAFLRGYPIPKGTLLPCPATK